jgi:hypothetical protein
MNNYLNSLTQNNHSIITSYPINYYNFPLAVNCKFIEIDLNENEYLFIPQSWMHWVYTEPFNLSMNYFIKYFNNNNNNPLINKLKKKQPYKSKIDNLQDFNFKDYFKNNFENKFSIVFNTLSHSTPVIKPNLDCKIFRKNMSIKECLGYEYKDYYKYIAQSESNNLFLNKLSNFINDADNIDYKPSIWINLDKNINSGLHYDDYDNILINFIGKKKVLLGHPDDRQYMYFQVLPIIDYKL